MLTHLRHVEIPDAVDDSWAWDQAKQADLALASMTDPDRWLPEFPDAQDLAAAAGHCNGGIDTAWLATVALLAADRNTL